MIPSNSSNSRNHIIGHTIFWICVFLYYMLSVNIINFPGGYEQLFLSTLNMVGNMMITAYVILLFLIPRFLNTGRNMQFVIGLLLLLIGTYTFYILYRHFFFDPKYYHLYSERERFYADYSLSQRFLSFSVFLSKCVKFLSPCALILMYKYYRDQKTMAQLNEQKKQAELSALKNQLNPHFLFNTLNNLYSLAVNGSTRTPEVIERLSELLDYILYRCNDKYVPLSNELRFLENYMELEKVRYGHRVEIIKKFQVSEDTKIAPLILMTFMENAFKHGVSQELDKATIWITIEEEQDILNITFENTIPSPKASHDKTEKLGLKNVKSQLDLLYPGQHDLIIIESEMRYSIHLKIRKI